MTRPTFMDLERAALREDLNEVKRLMHDGMDINCRNSRGASILHYLALVFPKSLKMIKELVNSHGADINAKDYCGVTPLHVVFTPVEQRPDTPLEDLDSVPEHIRETIEKDGCRLTDPKEILGYLQVWAVEEMATLGADLDAVYDMQVTSLHRAAKLGCTEACKALLRLGVLPNGVKHINASGLYLAVKDGQLRMTRQLVELGANVNGCVQHCVKPLNEAIISGNVEVFKLLVDYGAELNDSIQDITPLFLAIQLGYYDIARLLIQSGGDADANLANVNAVHQCIQTDRAAMLEYLYRNGANMSTSYHAIPALAFNQATNDMEQVMFLVENGADVNIRFDYYVPPLVLAIRHGSEELVRAILEAGVNPDEEVVVRDLTPLHLAIILQNLTMSKAILSHGGNANALFDEEIRPMHEAVALGNTSIVKVMAEYGANVNVSKWEGLCPLSYTLYSSRQEMHVPQSEALVKYGADVNQIHNERVTPLHDAVRLRDSEMVKTLAEFGANMDAMEVHGKTPFCLAIELGSKDVVSYLSEMGADPNMQFTVLRPLHLAVRSNAINVVQTLIHNGADMTCLRRTSSALEMAMVENDVQMLRHVIRCGGDINARMSCNVSILHDAVEFSNLDMLSTLLEYPLSEKLHKSLDISLLFTEVNTNNKDAAEQLLELGIHHNSFKSVVVTTLDLAKRFMKYDLVAQLELLGMVYGYQDSTLLHPCCSYGFIDMVRTLIMCEVDVHKSDHEGTLPFELLPLVHTVDYGALMEITTSKQLLQESSEIMTTGCKDMFTILTTPGLGSVRSIVAPDFIEMAERTSAMLNHITRNCKALEDTEVFGIGSAAEGTNVGLPNEMDFMFKVKTKDVQQDSMQDAGNGFVSMDFIIQRFVQANISSGERTSQMHDHDHTGSSGFHRRFFDNVLNALMTLTTFEPDDKLTLDPSTLAIVNKTNRKACSMIVLNWNDGFAKIRMTVDLVPSIPIHDWPVGGVKKTWLMNIQDLRERGYVLVPKPPHFGSKVAQKYTEKELQTLWKISFPHLETEHMQRLEQRIKDVYMVAKSLRNPDVCRVLIIDDGPFPKTVDKYISSYMLKMIFFKNVEYFLATDLGLEDMVCMVYDDLHRSLSQGFIPTFFLPNVDALEGRKVDFVKMTKVAEIMKRFARALKDRSGRQQAGAMFAPEDEFGYSSSVYCTYRIT